MQPVADGRRPVLVVEQARWDEAAKAIVVPIVLDGERSFGCRITPAAMLAVLERLMVPSDYLAALRRFSPALLAIAQAKVAAGGAALVTIDWSDVTVARWHI